MKHEGVFNVVVAEDEPIILENIVTKIEQTDLNFKVVSTAMNGRDALQLIEQLKPDVLFTDIQMPAMDGLELIKQAKAIKPDIEIVIISGYNDFSYAQQGIRLGVTDYILKPIKKDVLLQTITDVKKKLEQKVGTLEKDIIEKMFYGIKPIEAPPKYLINKKFQIHLICIGNLYTFTADVLDTDYYDRLWSMIDFPNIVDRYWDESVSWWIIDDKIFNQKFLVVVDDEHVANTTELMNAISSSLLDSIPVTICTEELPVGLEEFRDTSRSLRTSLERNLLYCRSSLILIRNRRPADRPAYNFDSVHMNSIKTLMDQQQFDSMQSELQHLFIYWETSNITQRLLEKQLVNLTTELMLIVGYEDNRILTSIEKELYEIVAMSSHYNSLFSDVLRVLNSYLGDYIYPRKKGNDTAEELYYKLEEYIRSNMSEPITVSTLAEKFNFNSSYIIRVFKKYSGEPPMKFLTSLRINEAKRLIESQTGLDFKIIAEIIGYSEQHYFSRVFKNITGMSPSEYRELMKKKRLTQK